MKEKKQQQEDDNQFNMNLLYAPELEKAVLGICCNNYPRGQSNADRYSNCKGAT